MKSLISIADLSPEEIWGLTDLALRLKAEQKAGGNAPLLAGKVLAMIFQKASLRTRVSFDVAMHQLGGHALYLSPQEVQLGERETIPDAARVLSRYVDVIVARTFAHRDVELLAQFATVPVVNGLSDLSHPCQALGDLLTIYEKRGVLRGLTVAYIGDGNNVAHSLMLAMSKVGANFRAASPPGYQCHPDMVAKARVAAAASGGSLVFTTDPREAAERADVLYTDVWASMGQESQRDARRAVFAPYQVNSTLVALASPEVLVMHCLPAHRGEEITDEVLDSPHSIVLDQAENRLHAQKAVLVTLLRQDVAGGY